MKGSVEEVHRSRMTIGQGVRLVLKDILRYLLLLGVWAYLRGKEGQGNVIWISKERYRKGIFRDGDCGGTNPFPCHHASTNSLTMSRCKASLRPWTRQRQLPIFAWKQIADARHSAWRKLTKGIGRNYSTLSARNAICSRGT
jgi:hypothetical protein